MLRPDADIAEYYETEARLGRRTGPNGRRIELRERFIELLIHEGRTSVIDVGAGPGRDGQGFRNAGFDFVGVDLAHGNGQRAAESGVDVVQGSAASLPFRASSFEAGWSLSTLMHLGAEDAAAAIEEMRHVLQPAAPVWIGLWGHETPRIAVEQDQIPGSRRRFHLRTIDQNRQIMAERCTIEDIELWASASGDWDYHVFRLRTLR